MGGKGRLITFLYLLHNTLTPLVHPAAVFCFHGGSGFFPLNLSTVFTSSRAESLQFCSFVKTPTSEPTLHHSVLQY